MPSFLEVQPLVVPVTWWSRWRTSHGGVVGGCEVVQLVAEGESGFPAEVGARPQGRYPSLGHDGGRAGIWIWRDGGIQACKGEGCWPAFSFLPCSEEPRGQGGPWGRERGRRERAGLLSLACDLHVVTGPHPRKGPRARRDALLPLEGVNHFFFYQGASLPHFASASPMEKSTSHAGKQMIPFPSLL